MPLPAATPKPPPTKAAAPRLTQKRRPAVASHPGGTALAQRLLDHIWDQAVRYHTKASDYVRRHEWLGSYYNTRLAIAACEHYLIAAGEHAAAPEGKDGGSSSSSRCREDERTQGFRTAADVQLQRADVRLTVEHLRSTIPLYEKRLRKFQSAFGCPAPRTPRSPGTSAPHSSSSPNEPGELDCTSVQEVELGDTTQHPVVMFQDIIGNVTAKCAIEDTLIHPVLMPHLYTDRTRALLFYGPPGTGKTLLAKATAHELNRRRSDMRVLFFAPTADEFKGKYVGETEEKIVRLFRCASQKAKALEQVCQEAKEAAASSSSPSSSSASSTRAVSIIFIDEIDSLAKRRDVAGDGPGGSVVASATNALLQVMDGMEAFDNVIVLAATNYPWQIDSAVLRRFGQKIHVSLPTEEDAHALLRKKIVGQLRRVLLADWGSVGRQERVQRLKFAYAQRTDEDLFFRWQTLHGISDEDVRVIAGDMCTSASKNGGYAPRDINRVCELTFRLEAQSAQSSSEGFFPVKLVAGRKSHPQFNEHAEELLTLLDGLHVSAATFGLLRKTYSWAIDTGVRPEYADEQQFPPLLTLHEGERCLRYTEWSRVTRRQPAADPPPPSSDAVATGDSSPNMANVDVHGDVRAKYHVYLHEEKQQQLSSDHPHEKTADRPANVLFLLYRTFRVTTQRQVHDVPVLLTGSVAVPATPKRFSLKTLLGAVDTLRFVYDGGIFQTRVVGGSGEESTDTGGGRLRLSVLSAGDSPEPLSIVNEQEKWWWTGVKQQVELVKQLAVGATNRVMRAAGTETRTTASEAVSETTKSAPPVSDWINRLFVKGCPRPSPGTAPPPGQNIAANVTKTVRVQFSKGHSSQSATTAAAADSSGVVSHSETRIRCAHLTCNMQTFLDARHEVHPSTNAKSIEDLLAYQRTGHAPA